MIDSKCYNCGARNRSGAERCVICDQLLRRFGTRDMSPTVDCPTCGAQNWDDRLCCYLCNGVLAEQQRRDGGYWACPEFVEVNNADRELPRLIQRARGHGGPQHSRQPEAGDSQLSGPLDQLAAGFLRDGVRTW